MIGGGDFAQSRENRLETAICAPAVLCVTVGGQLHDDVHRPELDIDIGIMKSELGCRPDSMKDARSAVADLRSKS